MIIDTMTYSVMTVVVAMSFIVILLAGSSREQFDNSDNTLWNVDWLAINQLAINRLAVNWWLNSLLAVACNNDVVLTLLKSSLHAQ